MHYDQSFTGLHSLNPVWVLRFCVFQIRRVPRKSANKKSSPKLEAGSRKKGIANNPAKEY